MYIAFRSSKLRWVFDSNENNEVQVMPHVVLLSAVLLKRDGLVVERRPFQAYKVLHRVLHLHSLQYTFLNNYTVHFL